MTWIHTPIYYGLDAVDLGILAACGLVAATMTYLLTERTKKRLPHHLRAWVPFVIAAALTAIGLPLVLDGLGDHGVTGRRLVGAVMLCTCACGLGAKWAHDQLVDLLAAAKARLISLISGSGGSA